MADHTDDHDADLDAFTAEMEGTDTGDGSAYIRVAPRRETIRAIRQQIAGVVYGDAIKDADVLYMEMLMAMGDVFLNVATQCLQQCDVEVFPQARDEILYLVGVFSAFINGVPPTQGALAEAPLVTEAVN